MVQERDDVVGIDAAIMMHPRSGRPTATSALHGPDGRMPRLPAPLPRRRPRERSSPRSRASTRAKALILPRRAPSTSCSRRRRTGEGERNEVYLRPETAQGIFVNFQNVCSRAAQAAVRHRADRQVVPQRDHARQLHLPHARVRADGDAVLRAARTRRTSGSATGSTSTRRGTSARASSRRTCVCASTRPPSSRTTRAGRATSSTSTRSAGPSSRASPTAATTTSSRTRSSRARSSSTSSRTASATCRT